MLEEIKKLEEVKNNEYEKENTIIFENKKKSNVFKNADLQKKQVVSFVDKLSKILPKVGSDLDKAIQIEVFVALSVEGVLTIENLKEKAPMVKAICEMIKMERAKKEVAVNIAKRLLH